MSICLRSVYLRFPRLEKCLVMGHDIVQDRGNIDDFSPWVPKNIFLKIHRNVWLRVLLSMVIFCGQVHVMFTL